MHYLVLFILETISYCPLFNLIIHGMCLVRVLVKSVFHWYEGKWSVSANAIVQTSTTTLNIHFMFHHKLGPSQIFSKNYKYLMQLKNNIWEIKCFFSSKIEDLKLLICSWTFFTWSLIYDTKLTELWGKNPFRIDLMVLLILLHLLCWS